LVTSTFTFDDFETARAALRAKLREFAFSHNEMFDSYGSMIHMEKYMDMIKREDGEIDDPLPGWFTGKIAVALLNIFSCIFEEKDVDISIPFGRYFNADIEADFAHDSITIRGTGEGVVNGYNPKIDTNLLSMQEEKDYYLYIDDMFGQWSCVSSELYIDLKKELDQLVFSV
jgi:hypothetical protein